MTRQLAPYPRDPLAALWSTDFPPRSAIGAITRPTPANGRSSLPCLRLKSLLLAPGLRTAVATKTPIGLGFGEDGAGLFEVGQED